MPAYVAIAYEYLFKDHPENFSAWMGAISDGAQHFGRLSTRASKIAKNITNCTTFFQIGYDLPLAFQSFRAIYDRCYNSAPFYNRYDTIETMKFQSHKEVKKPPLILDVCNAISSGAFLVDFTRRHILETKASSLTKLFGALADFTKGSFELYLHYQDPKEPNNFFSLDIRNLSFLCQKTSQLFLASLSLISLYKGVENPAPLLTLFLTMVYLGSHFTFYYKKHAPSEEPIKIVQD